MGKLLKQFAGAFSPVFTPAADQISNIENADWASPRQPIKPIIPPGLGVRTWDFHPALNLDFTPRGDRPVSFEMLQNFRLASDICKLAVETKKDQISNREYIIRLKQKPGETKKQRLQRESSNNDLAKVTALFQHPDGTHRSFRTWLREWADDMLVYDAPAILPIRNKLGDVFQLLS